MSIDKIKTLEAEKEMILKKIQEMEKQRDVLLTRCVEIQGVVRYLKEKDENQNDKK